jgi:hypothetical protein
MKYLGKDSEITLKIYLDNKPILEYYQKKYFQERFYKKDKIPGLRERRYH